MVTGEKVKFFAFGTDKGLELDYFRPEGFGIKNKITNSFMTENEWASLYFSYDRYRSKFENVGNKLVKLNEIAKASITLFLRGDNLMYKPDLFWLKLLLGY